jgi:hypothetical protein
MNIFFIVKNCRHKKVIFNLIQLNSINIAVEDRVNDVEDLMKNG